MFLLRSEECLGVYRLKTEKSIPTRESKNFKRKISVKFSVREGRE